MKKLLEKLDNRIHEPKTERVLLVLLPCIAVLISAAILAPRLTFAINYYIRQHPISAPSETAASYEETVPAGDPYSGPVSLPAPVPAAEAEVTEEYTVSADPLPPQTSSGWRERDGSRYYLDGSGNPAAGLKSIDGRLYYFNQYGVCASSLGIDVSFYNKGINWPAVKAQGIDFAIIRAGGRGWETGLLYDDSCFRQNINEARTAGLKLGVYYYSTAVDAVEAVQEASLVLERLHGAPLDFPIFIDVEQSGDYPAGRSDRLNKAQRFEIISAFCGTVRNAGYKAGVYSGQSFYKYNLDFGTLSQYYIWLASYTSGNRLPDFSGEYDMWQFTDRGVVNGITGKVDMNAIF